MVITSATPIIIAFVVFLLVSIAILAALFAWFRARRRKADEEDSGE